jgi:hypothetical protein
MLDNVLEVAAMARALIGLVVLLSIAGCGTEPASPTPVPPAPTPTQEAATVAPPTPPVAPVPSDTPVPIPTETLPPPVASISDAALLDLLKVAGLPIGEITIFTAETDANKLLGRPHQYIAKASWHDTRLPAPSDPKSIGVDDGGSIELFATEEDAKTRFDYVDAITRSPMFAEYHYLHGLVFLRVSGKLTPTQAAEYKTVFDTLP